MIAVPVSRVWGLGIRSISWSSRRSGSEGDQTGHMLEVWKPVICLLQTRYNLKKKDVSEDMVYPIFE